MQNPDFRKRCVVLNPVGGYCDPLPQVLADPVFAQVYLSANTPPRAKNVLAPLIYDTASSDDRGIYNATTGVFTIPITGKYVINGGVLFEPNPSNPAVGVDSWTARMVVVSTTDGVTSQTNTSYSLVTTPLLVDWTREFNAGDTISVLIGLFDTAGTLIDYTANGSAAPNISTTYLTVRQVA